jgi:hypothetical protein
MSALRGLASLDDLRRHGNVRLVQVDDLAASMSTLGLTERADSSPNACLLFEPADKLDAVLLMEQVCSDRPLPADEKQTEWLRGLFASDAREFLHTVVYAADDKKSALCFVVRPECRLDEIIAKYEHDPQFRFRNQSRVAFVQQLVGDVTNALLVLHMKHGGVHGALNADCIAFENGTWRLQLNVDTTRPNLSVYARYLDLVAWSHIVENGIVARMFPAYLQRLQTDVTKNIKRSNYQCNRICSFRDLHNFRVSVQPFRFTTTPDDDHVDGDEMTKDSGGPQIPSNFSVLAFFLWFIAMIAKVQSDEATRHRHNHVDADPMPMYPEFLRNALRLF